MTEQHESGELQLAGMNVLEMNRGKSMRFIYLRARNKVGDGWRFVQYVSCFCFAVFSCMWRGEGRYGYWSF